MCFHLQTCVALYITREFTAILDVELKRQIPSIFWADGRGLEQPWSTCL